MSSAVATQSRITFNQNGRAVVDGHFQVTFIVRDHINGGMTPREIHEAYANLSLAGVHAALAYYYDHQSEVDALIKSDDEFAEQAMRDREAAGNRFTRAELEQRLRDKGIRR